MIVRAAVLQHLALEQKWLCNPAEAIAKAHDIARLFLRGIVTWTTEKKRKLVQKRLRSIQQYLRVAIAAHATESGIHLTERKRMAF